MAHKISEKGHILTVNRNEDELQHESIDKTLGALLHSALFFLHSLLDPTANKILLKESSRLLGLRRLINNREKELCFQEINGSFSRLLGIYILYFYILFSIS